VDNVQKNSCINTTSSQTFKSDGKFSFILCHKKGGIAWTFQGDVYKERVKISFLVSYVSAGNTLPASDRMSGDDTRIGYTASNELSLSYGQRSVDQFVLVSGSPLGPMTRFYPFLSLVTIAMFSSCKAPSLTRGRVCSLECLHSLVRSLNDQ
jgi:hypothetical protein